MCECLQTIANKYPEPFHKPIQYDANKNLVALSWMAHIWELNSSGSINQNSESTLVLNYCPICGVSLVEEDQDES